VLGSKLPGYLRTFLQRQHFSQSVEFIKLVSALLICRFLDTMMDRDQTGQKVTLAVRVANLLMFTLVLICAIVFMATSPNYLSIVISVYTMIFALILVVLELQKVPQWMMNCFRSETGFVLHPRGRIGFVFAISLIMFGEGTFGIVLGCGLLLLVVVNALVLYKFPEDFSAHYSSQQTDSYSSSNSDGNFSAPPPRDAQAAASGPAGFGAYGADSYGAESSSPVVAMPDESSQAVTVVSSDI